MLQYGGAVVAEVALTVFALIPLWIIRREVFGGDEGEGRGGKDND